jgi:DNA-binding MarR family transcriptional regulator
MAQYPIECNCTYCKSIYPACILCNSTGPGYPHAPTPGSGAITGERLGERADMTSPADGATAPAPSVAEADAFPFETPTYLFHLLVAIDRQRDLRLEERLKALGLTVARYRAIGVIARLEPVNMSELADYSVVDRTTMTRTVDQLVAEGLADRATPPTDRRRVVLTLTDAGRNLYRRAVQVITDLNREMAVGLPDDLQRTVIRAEEIMLRNLVREPGLADRLMQFRRDAD